MSFDPLRGFEPLGPFYPGGDFIDDALGIHYRHGRMLGPDGEIHDVNVYDSAIWIDNQRYPR